MNDDLLDRIALLDPVNTADAAKDARAMADVVDARIDAAPSPPTASRLLRSRRAHALLAACLAFVLVAVVLVSMGRRDHTLAGSEAAGWITVGALQDLQRAVITYVPPANAFVIARTGEVPYALSAVSPHSPYGFEEPILYCRPSGQFAEPMAGSKFDVQGRYLVGPSPTGMYGVPLRIVGDDVQIDDARLSPAPVRGEHADPFVLCPESAVWSEPGFVDVGGSGNDLAEPTFFHQEGTDVTTGTFVSTWRGSDCGFPVPTVLQLTDPLGSAPANDAEDWRYYVADPNAVWSDLESSMYAQGDPLPSSVVFTGYRSHLFELWADPALIDREVWIVRSDPNGGTFTERWPRVEQIPQCSPPDPGS